MQLNTLIAFAYELTGSPLRNFTFQLPYGLATERFDIEARAAGNPTKAQMRLMMQSLLADRFKLGLHFERRQLPIYDLVWDKPGEPGPQLTPSTSGSCIETAPTNEWVQPCGRIGIVWVSGHWHVAARDLSMTNFASLLEGFAHGSVQDSNVIDRTGGSGLYDLRMEFTPGANALPLTPGTFTPDPNAPTFVQALKDQLGLKLLPQTGPVDMLILDHVEEPRLN